MAFFDREAFLKMADEADREDGISSGPGRGYYPTNGKRKPSKEAAIANSLPFGGDKANQVLDSQKRSRRRMAIAAGIHRGRKKD